MRSLRPYRSALEMLQRSAPTRTGSPSRPEPEVTEVSRRSRKESAGREGALEIFGLMSQGECGGPVRAAEVGNVSGTAAFSPISIDRTVMENYDADGRQLQRLSDSIGRHTFLDQHLNVPIEVLHQVLNEGRLPSRADGVSNVPRHGTTRHSLRGGASRSRPRRRSTLSSPNGTYVRGYSEPAVSCVCRIDPRPEEAAIRWPRGEWFGSHTRGSRRDKLRSAWSAPLQPDRPTAND